MKLNIWLVTCFILVQRTYVFYKDKHGGFKFCEYKEGFLDFFSKRPFSINQPKNAQGVYGGNRINKITKIWSHLPFNLGQVMIYFRDVMNTNYDVISFISKYVYFKKV